MNEKKNEIVHRHAQDKTQRHTIQYQQGHPLTPLYALVDQLATNFSEMAQGSGYQKVRTVGSLTVGSVQEILQET